MNKVTAAHAVQWAVRYEQAMKAIGRDRRVSVKQGWVTVHHGDSGNLTKYRPSQFVKMAQILDQVNQLAKLWAEIDALRERQLKLSK